MLTPEARAAATVRGELMRIMLGRNCLVATLAACGSLGLAAPRASAPRALQVTYQVHFDGTLTAGGTVSREAVGYKTCLEFALDKEKGALALTGKVGGHSFDFALPKTPLHGPGTYAAEREATNWLIFDGSQEEYNFNPGDKGVTTVTIQPNGSGSVTFSGWINPGSKPENGSVAWTCAG